MRTVIAFITLALALTILFALNSCGGNSGKVQSLPSATINSILAEQPAPIVSWPQALPVDKLQPWETLDGSGRLVSSINLQSQFVPGAERFLEAGDVTDLGEASRFDSGDVGNREVSYAIYRIPMGAEQPGTIAADVNVYITSDYYIGVADYSANSWRWHGPFKANHVRIPLPDHAYTSTLGNLMLAVVAFDGAMFDLVGLGVNARDYADTTAPDAPAAPVLTPIPGGLLAEWLPVVASDLAGYRVYANGVETLGFLEGGTSVVIPATGITEVTLRSVDISGNESDFSEPASASAIDGYLLNVMLATTAASGRRGEIIALNASGGESYDWDVDGDGIYDITDDLTGTAFADTDDLGIIRPSVRGHHSNGGFWMGAVSLVIAGNSRPVVMATADVMTGPAPLNVNFTVIADDDDGTIAEYAWDFEGDGIFDANSPTDPSPLPFSYAVNGMYNAKFRVTDNEGAWDVDSVTLLVQQPFNEPPVAVLTANENTFFTGISGDAEHVLLDASGSSDPEGTTLQFAWDPDGNGSFEAYGPDNTYDYTVSGTPRAITCCVRVMDEGGGVSEAKYQITLYRFNVHLASEADVTDEIGTYSSMAAIGGVPAIAHYNFTDEDLLYSYVTSLPPASEDNWTTHIVDSTNSVGRHPSLCAVGNLPAIAYYDATNGDLKFARAITENPEDNTQWDIHVVDSTGTVGAYPSMVSFTEGFMPSTRYTVIAYYDSTNTALKLAFATGTPNDPTDWTIYTLDDSASVGNYTSITSISDGFLFGDYRVGICYYDATNDDLKWMLSDAWPPTIWDMDVIDDGGGVDNVGMYCSIYRYSSAGLSARYPIISYYDSTNGSVKFARATVPYPTNAAGGDWITYTLEDGGGNTIGQSSSPLWYHGCPMVFYNNDTTNEFYMARAMNSAPVDETEWWTHLISNHLRPLVYNAPSLVFEDKPVFASFNVAHPVPPSNLFFGWPVAY